MYKYLSVAAVVAVASAACPNQCSGHGYCDENDRCICYRAPGTKGQLRAAWTGADCSQRVCPYGTSFDVISDADQELLSVNNAGTTDVALFRKGDATKSVAKLKAFLNNGFLLDNDLGLDVKIVSVDTALATAKFQYKLSTERTFYPEETLTTNPPMYADKKTAYQVRPTVNGVKDTETGLFLYFDVNAADLSTAQTIFAGDQYYMNVTYNDNVKFQADNLNTAHGNIECSGRGACDRATGTCKCTKGYTGDACQRTECINDCSGHGTCQSLKYFVEDAGKAAYTAFDADGQMGCKCDTGFRGADCSQIECPSGADPLKADYTKGDYMSRDCSGRGLCDYTTGICQCFKGYFGERCEEQSNLV